MNIAENLLKIEAIVKELKLLMAYASPLDKSCLFEPYVRLHAETSQGVIEADRLGNATPEDAENLVKTWFQDKTWEQHL